MQSSLTCAECGGPPDERVEAGMKCGRCAYGSSIHYAIGRVSPTEDAHPILMYQDEELLHLQPDMEEPTPHRSYHTLLEEWCSYPRFIIQDSYQQEAADTLRESIEDPARFTTEQQALDYFDARERRNLNPENWRR